jgi:hypothetical protein
MAAGNQQSGEYSFKFTSFTLTPGPGYSIVIQGNCEGTGTGYGTGLCTMTAVGGNSGTVSWCARHFLESGEAVIDGLIEHALMLIEGGDDHIRQHVVAGNLNFLAGQKLDDRQQHQLGP